MIKCRAKGYSDLVTVVGSMPEVHFGAVLSLTGEWTMDSKYGRQFSIESFEEPLPVAEALPHQSGEYPSADTHAARRCRRDKSESGAPAGRKPQRLRTAPRWSGIPPREKVMQIRNNYEKEVFNGDIGVVQDANPKDRELSVQFDDCLVVYDAAELDELVLAYATTIHKSQGSKYPIVVIPVLMTHYVMLYNTSLTL